METTVQLTVGVTVAFTYLIWLYAASVQENRVIAMSLLLPYVEKIVLTGDVRRAVSLLGQRHESALFSQRAIDLCVAPTSDARHDALVAWLKDVGAYESARDAALRIEYARDVALLAVTVWLVLSSPYAPFVGAFFLLLAHVRVWGHVHRSRTSSALVGIVRSARDLESALVGLDPVG